MADLRARSSAPSPADSGAFSFPDSASRIAARGPQAELRDQCEQLGEQLLAVRDYLALLADCCAANSDTSAAPLNTEVVAVTFIDLADQLGETMPAFDTLCELTTQDQFKLRRAIEQQGDEVCTVQYMLRTLYAALGDKSGTQHQFRNEALGCTMQRLAERIGAVEIALMALVYDRRAAALPPPPPAPAAQAAGAAVPVDPPPASQMPVKPRKPRVPARAARSLRASKEAAACA